MLILPNLVVNTCPSSPEYLVMFRICCKSTPSKFRTLPFSDRYCRALNTNRHPREISHRDFRFHRSSETLSSLSPATPPMQKRIPGDFIFGEISARSDVVLHQPIWCAISQVRWDKSPSAISPFLAADRFSPILHRSLFLGCFGFVASLQSSHDSKPLTRKLLLSRPSRQPWSRWVYYWWNQ